MKQDLKFDPLSDHRREFLARTVMDVVKLGCGAGFVSSFFGNLPTKVRMALGVGIVVLFVIAWVLLPPKSPKGGD